MARQQNLGASEEWFVGEDKTIPFEIYDGANESLIKDITGFALTFRMRRKADGDRVVVTKTTAGATVTITGVFNATPATNTQRANVLIVKADTLNFQPGDYYYGLWRTDSGNETVLAYGDLTLKRAA